jgi:hypothetical protein
MKTAGRENPNRRDRLCNEPSPWGGRPKPSLLNQGGWRSRKHPAEGRVFFLTSPFIEPSPSGAKTSARKNPVRGRPTGVPVLRRIRSELRRGRASRSVDREYLSAARWSLSESGLSALTARTVSEGFQANPVIDRFPRPLFAAQITLSCLHADMPKQELDLFKLATCLVA